MKLKLLVITCCSVAFLCLSRHSIASDGAVAIYTGQPGAYEIHHYFHRPNTFDRAPYFATHPPVYYGPERLARSYGWTPYPYLGTQFRQPLVQKLGATKKSQKASAKPQRKRSGQRRKSRSRSTNWLTSAKAIQK